jgi:tetratricopeptide (TPR) repeat protein
MLSNIQILDSTDAAALLRDYCHPRLIFCGAGISNTSGLPLANDLKNALLRELCSKAIVSNQLWQNNREIWERNLKKIMLESMLEIIARSYQGVEDRLSPLFLIASPSYYHYRIAQLLGNKLVPEVITTNFDDLLERAYRELRTQNPSMPELCVVVESNDSYLAESPRLIKFHGCATRPRSIALTLAQVGKGLDEWKKRHLMRAASTYPFLFIGYSDRDKDISPILSSITNNWIWLFHDALAIEDHVPHGSLLDRMLAKPNRVAIHTDIEKAFKAYCNAIGSYPDVSPSSQKANWMDLIVGAFDDLDTLHSCVALGDILYELLGDWKNAEIVLLFAQRLPNLSKTTLTMLDIRRKRVLIDQWKLQELEQSLQSLPLSAIDDGELSPDIRAQIAHTWAAAYQKRAVQSSEEAERLFAIQEVLLRQAARPADAAMSIMNRAVVLQKRGHYRKSEELYKDSISELRDAGHLPHLAKALVNYGSLLGIRGRNDEALKIYEEAMDIFFMLGEDLWVARLKINIGNLLIDIGKPLEAVQFLRDAEEVLCQFEDSYWLKNAREAISRIT